MQVLHRIPHTRRTRYLVKTGWFNLRVEAFYLLVSFNFAGSSYVHFYQQKGFWSAQNTVYEADGMQFLWKLQALFEYTSSSGPRLQFMISLILRYIA